LRDSSTSVTRVLRFLKFLKSLKFFLDLDSFGFILKNMIKIKKQLNTLLVFHRVFYYIL
jgi:hypothetical protein